MKHFLLISIFLLFLNKSFAQQIGNGFAPTIPDFGSILTSGVYGGVGASGATPDVGFGWQHLFVIRHENASNNHQFQLATSYAVNDRLFFRKIATILSPANTSWIELATRGSNSFVGDQAFIGNVGIGTSIPSQKLNVDPGGAGGILIGNPNTGVGGYTSLRLSISGNSGGFSEIQSVKSSGSEWGKLVLNQWGGYVGIGTANPQNLLDVNGTIRAKEIKVETGWADFVFHPSYKLKPLREVEQFIKINGHLQDIPSAAEVEQNGVNVGEMQKMLLQKVEELTLYVIEQNRKIEQQSLKIKELEEKIKN